MGNDVAKFKDVADALDQATGGSMRNAIDVARAMGGGMRKNNYLLDANIEAAAVVKVITGCDDPFHIPPQRDIDLAARLGSSFQTFDDEKSGEPKSEYCVSAEARDAILVQYKRWIDVDDERNISYTFPSSALPLPFIKVTRILRHVLETMFDSSYERSGNAKQHKKQKYYHMRFEASPYFQRGATGLNMPIVKCWRETPLRDLAEGELMEMDGDIVQPCADYLARRGQEFSSKYQMPPLQSDDVLNPLAKKRKVASQEDAAQDVSTKRKRSRRG
jgi:hypothetical protein